MGRTPAPMLVEDIGEPGSRGLEDLNRFILVTHDGIHHGLAHRANDRKEVLRFVQLSDPAGLLQAPVKQRPHDVELKCYPAFDTRHRGDGKIRPCCQRCFLIVHHLFGSIHGLRSVRGRGYRGRGVNQ